MKLNFRIYQKDVTKESWFDPDFCSPYIELIDMKCLDCDYEEPVEADIVLECFEMTGGDFPLLHCPHCNDGNFVPKDCYDQIKGNFVYTFKK
ncbi:MAG: hypothetical protein HUK24_06070 [Sphaerochaetaceae bacterium]|nr:hypothetical protein [Sphaerochaetaceae bacterium]